MDRKERLKNWKIVSDVRYSDIHKLLQEEIDWYTERERLTQWETERGKLINT